jgi:hypothetical protein
MREMHRVRCGRVQSCALAVQHLYTGCRVLFVPTRRRWLTTSHEWLCLAASATANPESFAVSRTPIDFDGEMKRLYGYTLDPNAYVDTEPAPHDGETCYQYINTGMTASGLW